MILLYKTINIQILVRVLCRGVKVSDFIGRYLNKVDKKGRVSVPAAWRPKLIGKDFSGIIAQSSFAEQTIDAYPRDYLELLQNKLDLNEYLIKHPAATFIVRASGFSMTKASIYSGDLLIVDRSITPKNNSIVIASIFGDLTVKKLKKKEKSFFLISANDEYPSIEVKEEMECFIWGVVTYTIHETTSA